MLLTLAAYAGETRPPSGVDVDETKKVGLLKAWPASCLAIKLEAGHVFLSRSHIETLASYKRPPADDSEEGRLAENIGLRAQRLLQAMTDKLNEFGCREASLDDDSQYLVSNLLEEGKVAIVRKHAKHPEQFIYVRYLAQRCGPMCGSGDIMFLLEGDQKPIFSVSWWVS